MQETLTSTRFLILALIVACATVLCALGKLTAETWGALVIGISAGFGTAIVSAKTAANGGPVIKALLPLALVGALMGGCICQTPRACLVTAQRAISIADKPALDAIGAKCMAEATKCGPVGSANCPGWVACDAARAKYKAAVDAIDKSLAVVNRLLAEIGVK